MIKDNYMGFQVKLKFSKTDDLALRVYRLGRHALMYKIDLRRYFRQLPLDPGDYNLVGYIIEGELYFDKVLPMGMWTAPYIAQRISNAIRFIHEEASYFLLNYVDDLVGAEDKVKANKAFQELVELLETVGLDTAPDKVTPPTTRLEFLGVTYDTDTMTLEVTEDKLVDIKGELHTWLYKDKATRREVESLIGKLQFASKCVRAGRIFISRLLNWLRTLPRGKNASIPLEARKDIAWWSRFMQQYNGISIMWLHRNPQVDRVIASDASSKGFGAWSQAIGEYLRGRFPKEWQHRNIAELEMLAVVVALKAWATQLEGWYFWIHVDNEAVLHVLNTGRSRNTYLQDALKRGYHASSPASVCNKS